MTNTPPPSAQARLVWPLALTIGLAGPAQADGEFFQADYAENAGSITATVQRDRITVSLGWSESEAGAARSLWANYGLPVAGNTWLRIGPSIRLDAAATTDWGLRAGLERYTTSGANSLFLLADFNTIQREYLALAQWGHMPTGLAFEVVMQGNDAGYRERSLTASLRIGNGPLRLRAGYRFDSGQPFIGVSINTF